MMPVRRTQSWLPSIFNDFFDNDWMVKANATAPAINVFETEKEYKVELAAPGMTKRTSMFALMKTTTSLSLWRRRLKTKKRRKKVAIYVANSLILSFSRR